MAHWKMMNIMQDDNTSDNIDHDEQPAYANEMNEARANSCSEAEEKYMRSCCTKNGE